MIDRLALRTSGRLAVAALAIALVAAACGGAASSTPPSPTPGGGPLTQAEAVAKVLAQDPRFADIGPLDPNLIGQAAWYEVGPGTVGWRVTITIGWGDCQAGCISKHAWVYDVDGAGAVRLVDETGDALPDATDAGGSGSGTGDPPVAIPADGGPWLVGRVLAGPACPVVENPPDPECADRAVAGAVMVVRGSAGTEIARATTAADGTFIVAVPGAGSYTVEPQPVEGLLGTPEATTVEVGDGPAAWAAVELAYDTGIR